MKQLIIILLLIESICTYAQNSSVDEIHNEFLPNMSSKQRIALNAFETLKVIDTDENCTWIYRNSKWERLFTKEAIQQVQKDQVNRLNSNESWKKFDEESRPQTDVSVSIQSSVDKPNSTLVKKSNFRYAVYKSDLLEKMGLQFTFEVGEKIAYLKIYTNDNTIDLEGFNHFAIKEESSLLIRPYNELKNNVLLKFIKKENNNFSAISNLGAIKGVLVAYIK